MSTVVQDLRVSRKTFSRRENVPTFSSSLPIPSRHAWAPSISPSSPGLDRAIMACWGVPCLRLGERNGVTQVRENALKLDPREGEGEDGGRRTSGGRQRDMK